MKLQHMERLAIHVYRGPLKYIHIVHVVGVVVRGGWHTCRLYFMNDLA